MRVVFNPEHLRTLEAHLEAAYPNEGAGFLLGRITDGAFVVESVLPIENRWDESSQRNRFRLEPADSFRAEIAAAKAGASVVGVFHSHPDHPAEPSQWDLAWASWPNFSYLITTVAGDGERVERAIHTRAWRLRDDRSAFEEDVIEIQ